MSGYRVAFFACAFVLAVTASLLTFLWLTNPSIPVASDGP